MNQKEELNNIMLQIQNYLKSHNVDITFEELYETFQEYGISEQEKNKPISDNDKKQIRDMLNRKKVKENVILLMSLLVMVGIGFIQI